MTRSPQVFKILSVVFILFGILAIIGSIFLWGEGFYFNFPKRVDLAFPTADIFINGPASIIAGIGLWRFKKWGILMAWFSAGIYIYASVEIFILTIQEGTIAAEIIFPQILAVITAIVVMISSWKWSNLFN